MATYKSETFLTTPTSNETFLKIRDVSGNIRYKIYNNTINSRFINGNNLFIKTSPDAKVIKLDFSTNTEASNALIKLNLILQIVENNYNNSQS